MIDVLALWMDAKADKTDTKLDDQLVPLNTKTLKVFVAVLGGIFVLQKLNVDVGSLLAGVGLGGLAFALAAKDTIANFFGSVMIFIDKPFQIGDWIVIGGVEGTVEEVGFRTTRVRTFYNSLVTVPNASITTNNVDNYGLREYRRYNTTLGLSYDTPVPKVQAFCEGVRALITGMPGMRKDYFLVEFHSFGDSTLNIMLYCFMICDDWNEELRIRTHLNLEIMRVAQELGVSFAFPTQTLHVDTLAASGGHNPSHSGPSADEELAAVVDGFAKEGKLQNYRGHKIADRYDCGSKWEQEAWK
jgi:MscS family membrane protein